MKQMMAMAIVALAVLSAFALKRDPEYLSARRNGAEMKMNLRVVDDAGEIVSNAAVRVLMGMNFRERCYFIDGQTDTNGLFVIEGKTAGDEVVVDIEKDGYYKSHRKYCFITMGAEREVKDGKWQPYGAEERLELRRIRKPIDLIHFYDYVDIPKTNIWIGVDMMKRQFAKPHGEGEYTDFEIKVDWDGQSPPRSKFCACEVRFVGLHSAGTYERNVLESEYPYAYVANTNGMYEVMSVCVVDRKIDGEGNRMKIPLRKDSSLVIRTRCKRDEQGGLISAHYGMLRALGISPGWNNNPATILIDYVFNPTPNDANLEAKP